MTQIKILMYKLHDVSHNFLTMYREISENDGISDGITNKFQSLRDMDLAIQQSHPDELNSHG